MLIVFSKHFRVCCKFCLDGEQWAKHFSFNQTIICPLRFTFLDTLSLESSKVFGAYIDRLRRVGRYKLISDLVAVLVAHGQALHLPGLELGADIAFN